MDRVSAGWRTLTAALHLMEDGTFRELRARFVELNEHPAVIAEIDRS
jgi:hypothetical protein